MKELGYGVCNNGQCQCTSGREGRDCSRVSSSNKCSSHGTLKNVGSIPVRRRKSVTEDVIRFASALMHVCFSLRAVVHFVDQICICDAGWVGEDCTSPVVKTELPLPYHWQYANDTYKNDHPVYQPL
jgi:hypothetical protein